MFGQFFSICVFAIVLLIIAVGCFFFGYLFHCSLTDKKNDKQERITWEKIHLKEREVRKI